LFDLFGIRIPVWWFSNPKFDRNSGSARNNVKLPEFIEIDLESWFIIKTTKINY